MLTHMLQTLTPAQFRVWVAGQLTDGSSSQVAKLLGLNRCYVLRCQRAELAVKAKAKTEELAMKANSGPNAVVTRARAGATPLEVEYLSIKQEKGELAAQRKEAEEALAGWAAKMGYQPLSEMPVTFCMTF